MKNPQKKCLWRDVIVGFRTQKDHSALLVFLFKVFQERFSGVYDALPGVVFWGVRCFLGVVFWGACFFSGVVFWAVRCVFGNNFWWMYVAFPTSSLSVFYIVVSGVYVDVSGDCYFV